MSSTAVLAIYLSIAIIGVAAVVLGIINWILYSNASSAITELNDEIEKKGREFDTLKNNPHQPASTIDEAQTYTNTEMVSQQQEAPIQEMQENSATNVEPSQNLNVEPNLSQTELPEPAVEPVINENETPQIDIVRNVRGDFENPTSAGGIKRETVIMKIPDLLNEDTTSEIQEPENTAPKENDQNDAIYEEPITNEAIEISGDTIIDNPQNDSLTNQQISQNLPLQDSNTYNQMPSNPFNDSNENTINEPTTGAPSLSVDIMDVISEPDEINSIGSDKIHGITVSLYSKAQNDADFKAMWMEIQKILQDAVIPVQINIDFSDVFFLYKEEMDYLKKVYTNVKSNDFTLGFINCSPELVKVLWKDDELGNLILDI